MPCPSAEGYVSLQWKDVKGDLPRSELAKGNMSERDAKAALKRITEALNVKVHTEMFALYPAHRPISATNEEWSNDAEAANKLVDVFGSNKAVEELGSWAAPIQKDFREAYALGCINDALNPIVSASPAPRP